MLRQIVNLATAILSSYLAGATVTWPPQPSTSTGVVGMATYINNNQAVAIYTPEQGEQPQSGEVDYSYCNVSTEEDTQEENYDYEPDAYDP